MKRIFLSVLAVMILIPLPAVSADAPLLAQNPTMNDTHVVFVFANDLWKVPREGGAAQRLTSNPGIETYPVFSPDGSAIAFTGEYDGNVDVFVIPAEGGEPQRLTWHPSSDLVLGWTPDGKKILFASGRNAYSRFNELYTVTLEGGLPEKLPLPMGYEGSFSPDGKSIAYVPLSRAFRVWKRYRGGLATPIWIADLADSSVVKVPRKNSNDFNPMWIGDKVYFLSDRDGPCASILAMSYLHPWIFLQLLYLKVLVYQALHFEFLIYSSSFAGYLAISLAFTIWYLSLD